MSDEDALLVRGASGIRQVELMPMRERERASGASLPVVPGSPLWAPARPRERTRVRGEGQLRWGRPRRRR